jgi:pilus assembly protein CpaB
MSLRAVAVLVVAVILGLVAVFAVNSILGHANKPAPVAAAGPGAGAPVVVAAKPIARGVTITPDLLKVVNFPVGAAPDGSFGAITELTGGKDVQRVAFRDLSVGEPVLKTRVSDPGGKLSLSDVLTPGMQAVSLRTNDISGVAGFVLPGDHVDVLLTRTATPPSGGAPTTLVQVVVEDLKVLGIDQVDDPEARGPMVVKAITVEVTPQQAQTITLAQTMGAVTFSLRHVQDSARLTRIATSAKALELARPSMRKPDDYGLVRVTRETSTTIYQLSSR